MVSEKGRWRVLGNSLTTLIAASLERSCGGAGARGGVAVTAARWPRPGNLCVCVHVYALMPGYMVHGTPKGLKL